MPIFRVLLTLSLALLCGSQLASAWQPTNEQPAEPTREFRAAWVSTVFNIDWPSRTGLSAAKQRAELLDILNTAARLRMNAIILQVRPNSDAFYNSKYEPWSSWLSGAGVNPGYDPLAFAVAEAHKRGIEIHAWFNPFRAGVGSARVGRGHISQRKPHLIKRTGSHSMLLPSSSESQEHVTDVIMDVVKRYDIDGVHLDDYFYPYPPHKLYDGLTPAKRRAAIDRFVQNIYSEIKSKKPWVRVGISPFGVWQPGYPSDVKAGVNAYEHLACDGRKWLAKGWVDYLAPQLYWRDAGDQSFSSLMRWWSAINPRRPVWPGIASQRIKSKEDPGRRASEIGRQIDFSRRLARQSPGQLFWSWSSIGKNRGGVQSQLRARYWDWALPPSMPWCGNSRPDRPQAAARDKGHIVQIGWRAGDNSARKWVIQIRQAGRWYAVCVLPGAQKGVALPSSMLAKADRIAVRPISATGNSGPAAVLAR